MFEAAGMLLGVAALLSGMRLDLALMAVPALLILLSLPTQGRFETFRREFHENATLLHRK